MTWLGVLLLVVATVAWIVAAVGWFDYREERFLRAKRGAFLGFVIFLLAGAWAAVGAILILRN